MTMLLHSFGLSWSFGLPLRSLDFWGLKLLVLCFFCPLDLFVKCFFLPEAPPQSYPPSSVYSRLHIKRRPLRCRETVPRKVAFFMKFSRKITGFSWKFQEKPLIFLENSMNILLHFQPYAAYAYYKLWSTVEPGTREASTPYGIEAFDTVLRPLWWAAL